MYVMGALAVGAAVGGGEEDASRRSAAAGAYSIASTLAAAEPAVNNRPLKTADAARRIPGARDPIWRKIPG